MLFPRFASVLVFLASMHSAWGQDHLIGVDDFFEICGKPASFEELAASARENGWQKAPENRLPLFYSHFIDDPIQEIELVRRFTDGDEVFAKITLAKRNGLVTRRQTECLVRVVVTSSDTARQLQSAFAAKQKGKPQSERSVNINSDIWRRITEGGLVAFTDEPARGDIRIVSFFRIRNGK